MNKNIDYREKSLVHKNLERVVRDLQEAKEKCDELRASKQVSEVMRRKKQFVSISTSPPPTGRRP